LLGEVRPPRSRQRATGEHAPPPKLDPADEDAYHFIVASMDHELAGVSGKSIAVTSARMANGKTSTALRIANAASRENRRILLIDADVRMQLLSKRVGEAQIAAESDGTTMLPGEPTCAADYLDRLVVTDGGMVLPVAARPTEPWHTAGSNGSVDVRRVVRSIGELFDLVLIDTPPLLATSNALAVAGSADGVVLVVSHRIALKDLREVRERLDFVKTPLIGYVYVRPRGGGVARTLWERVK
jgi:Mrp family chromosome partitioning ATPase